MLSKVLASFAALGLIVGTQAEAQVNVQGYTKSNGTYVQPHVRTRPDGNPYNNYSSPGGSVYRNNSGSYQNSTPRGSSYQGCVFGMNC